MHQLPKNYLGSSIEHFEHVVLLRQKEKQMFPDKTYSTKGINSQANVSLSQSATPYENMVREFVGEVRSQLATLTGEVALRNKVIMENDSYVYGDLLSRMLDVPIGHDFTPVNWLRRVAEIHRSQTMGDGFTISSSYHGEDINANDDPQAQQAAVLNNTKKKAFAEMRNELIESIMRDNGGHSIWARAVENASVTGDAVLKAWYDPETGKYHLELVEAVEHFYALWSRSNFREWDMVAYVYQISKQQAVDDFGVPPDVATSPLGMPLAVLSSANIVEYISTQPMVTIMEITGRAQGWGTSGGMLHRVNVGNENPINAVIVGDRVKKLVDDPKYMPSFYKLPNKLIRRRPWGLPDITPAAININLTYIETLSDWRTLSSKLNFPKYKAFGFGLDTELPKPKRRTVEFIGLGEGQDIQPIQNPNSEGVGQKDFEVQIAELKEEFVRETGISQVLFDNPDTPQLSGQAMIQAMGPIGDQVEARRQLWTPLIQKIFEDALRKLALWDDNIKDLVADDSNWFLRVLWPSALRKDDPAYQTMLINRLNTNTISIQTFLEKHGETKEELDRIIDELNHPELSAIHGRMLGALAQMKFFPPATVPPKVTVGLTGVLTPDQEANLAAEHGFNNGPIYGPTSGPQGQQGIRAINDYVDQGMVTGQTYVTGQPVQYDSSGNPVPNPPNQYSSSQAATGPTLQQGQAPMQTPPTNNQPGQQPVSQPGSGAPNVSPQGAVNQHNQRRGR